MATADSTRISSDADRSMIVMAQGTIAFVALLMLLGLWNSDGWAEVMTWPLCALFSLHFVWCFWSWNTLTGRWFDGYTVFFLSLCLFNGGQFLLEALGLNRDGILGGQFSPFTVNRTILLVNAAAAAYHFGGVFRCPTKSWLASADRSPASQQARVSFPTERAKAIGLLFLIASVPTTLWGLMNSYAHGASQGYMSLFQQDLLLGADNWQAVLNTFFAPGLLFTFAMFHKSRQWVGLCWALMIGYVAANMAIGSRGAAIMACVPVLLLHHSLVKRIRPLYLLSACLCAGILLPFVGQTRNSAIEDRLSMIDGLMMDNPIVATVSEMGSSAGAVAYTLELVPSRREYDWGMGYGYALLAGIPNLFWDRHISAQWGSYSVWLVWTVDPRFAGSGGGLGFSVLAEAYANFAIFGPPLIGGILGFVIAALSSWTRSRPLPFMAGLEAVFLGTMLVLPRSESAMVCRSVLWFCVIPYLCVVYSREHYEAHNRSADLQRASPLR